MDNFPKDTMKCTWSLQNTTKIPHHSHTSTLEHKKIYNSALEMIGNTPMVRLNAIPKNEGLKCEILAKCEFSSVGGSIKDRIALRMINEAEKAGLIRKGDTLIAPTSGNTGIGIALVSALRGFDVNITIPDRMSNEKVDLLKALGAKVYRTPSEAAWLSEESYFGVSKKLNADIKNSLLLDQYIDLYNPMEHYDSTGPEIIQQTDNNLDVVVMTAGTGGTITGVSRYIKEKNKMAKIVGVDPIGSVLALPPEMNININQPFKVEGIGKSFIPHVLDRSVIDEWYKSNDKESFIMARRLIKEEGLLVGASSGACLCAAINYAKTHNLDENHRIVVVLPDSIRNYMSRFLSVDWMVENKFLPLEELDTNDHKLSKFSVDDLKLKKIECQKMSLTIGEAMEIFQKEANYAGIPILDETEDIIKGVIFEEKLIHFFFSKNLSKESPAYQTMTKEFVLVIIFYYILFHVA